MQQTAAGNLHRGGGFLAEFRVMLQLGVGLDEDVGAIDGSSLGGIPRPVH